MRIVPRAIYYLHPTRPLGSLINIFIGRKLKRGKLVQEFESKFSIKVNQNFSYATGHARIALYGILKSLSLEPGSEVVMTPINLPDMANSILMNSLKPRYCDLLPNSIEPDYSKCLKLLNSKSKVFLYTHLYGIVPDMNKMVKFCQDNNLLLIQDCTQSIGVLFREKPITTFAAISYYSLCDLKLIHTHRGAMVTTNDENLFNNVVNELEKNLKKLSKKYFLNFIMEDLAFSILLRRKVYAVFVWPYLKYLFSQGRQEEAAAVTRGAGIEIFGIKLFENLFGDEGSYIRKKYPDKFFYNYTEMQAELGIEALNKIDFIDNKRIDNTLLFISYLSTKVKLNYLIRYDIKNKNTFWKIPIISYDFKNLQKFLFANNIDSASINLPVINSLNCFKNEDNTNNAATLKNFGLCIPCHHYLSEKEIFKIADCVNKYFEGRCG